MVVDEASEEANVLFVAIHKVSPVVDLSQSDIVVRDDNKAPAAILGFRPDQISKICQRKVESSASPQDRKFRFLKPGWGSARGKGWRRPLLRTSSPLKPKNQPRTHIAIGTARGHFNHIGVRCMGMLKDLP
jgi:hypothetical protein